MKETRVFVTDCEGPISKNDNAFELACHFVPEGEKFFTQVSRYDDVLADVVKRDGYKAGDTLKLIVPFFKAYGVTEQKMTEFSAQNIMLMPGALEALQFLKERMPCFIVSTSYEHYIRTLCSVLGFPYENAYCTKLDIDAYRLSVEEQNKLRGFRQEICALPLIEVPEEAKSLQDLSSRDRQTVKRLDDIFWKEISTMKIGAVFEEVNPVGGAEKAKAARNIVDRMNAGLGDVMYVGDSITDVECFRLIREKGGITISFNGNAYAVREAEIAVLSTNAIVVAVLADVYNKHGREAVYRFVDEWGYESLKKYGLAPWLCEKVLGVFPEKLPPVCRITEGNVQALAVESGAFRRMVRGERVGWLG
ncbi:MAG: hypothetical protein ACLFU9_05800 [Candidatus Bathyarchaeia archaeon]